MTSLMAAFGRAYHSENESNPVFNDFLAKRLMSPKAYDVLCGYVLSGADFFEPEAAALYNGKTGGKANKNGSIKNELNKRANSAGRDLLLKIVNKHIAANPICRSAYAETEVEKSSGEGGAQYIILGAGLDTFAFRKTKYINHNMVFEVEHPLTQADKQRRMSSSGLKIKENHKFVAFTMFLPKKFNMANVNSKKQGDVASLRFCNLRQFFYLSSRDEITFDYV